MPYTFTNFVYLQGFIIYGICGVINIIGRNLIRFLRHCSNSGDDHKISLLFALLARYYDVLSNLHSI